MEQNFKQYFSRYLKGERTAFQAFSLVFFFLVVFFQLATLNVHSLNGDEGIYSLIKDDFSRLLQGHIPSPNPVIDYAGPFDFWIMGSVYGLIDYLFKPLLAEAWMVRIVPFLLWSIGTWRLYCELKLAERSKNHSIPTNTAPWFLILSVTCPMILVFTRLSFPHSLLLGLISLLLASVMNGVRLNQHHLLTWALISGIAIETHTSGFLAVGMASVFGLANFQNLKRPKNRNTIRKLYSPHSLLAALVFIGLLLPVFKNFPPPLANPDLPSRPFLFQIRNVFTILSGTHPLEFWFTKDGAPPFLAALYGFGIIALFIYFVARAKSIAPRFRWFSYVHLMGFILIAWMARRGRSLETLGNDRYLLFLIPGFLVITALSIASILRLTKQKRLATFTVFTFLTILFVVRFVRPVVTMMGIEDPNRELATYLVDHCKPDSCVAEVENFWAYWPVRFYTFGRVNLNVYDYNWKKVAEIDVADKGLIHCKFSRDENSEMTASDVVKFGHQGNPLAQICYFKRLPEADK